MRLLLDTQIVIWVATGDPRLSAQGLALVCEPSAEILFSVASLWEIAIKSGLGRADFRHSAAALRHGALEAGWTELAVEGHHALAVADLPDIHGDPFDRLLLAQARVEGARLVTSDQMLGRYGHPVLRL